jgi:hypothetical protein
MKCRSRLRAGLLLIVVTLLAVAVWGPVRVPAKAGTGTARATFSFDSWRGVRVTPLVIDMPIKDPGPHQPLPGTALGVLSD